MKKLLYVILFGWLLFIVGKTGVPGAIVIGLIFFAFISWRHKKRMENALEIIRTHPEIKYNRTEIPPTDTIAIGNYISHISKYSEDEWNENRYTDYEPINETNVSGEYSLIYEVIDDDKKNPRKIWIVDNNIKYYGGYAAGDIDYTSVRPSIKNEKRQLLVKSVYSITQYSTFINYLKTKYPNAEIYEIKQQNELDNPSAHYAEERAISSKLRDERNFYGKNVYIEDNYERKYDSMHTEFYEVRK